MDFKDIKLKVGQIQFEYLTTSVNGNAIEANPATHRIAEWIDTNFVPVENFVKQAQVPQGDQPCGQWVSVKDELPDVNKHGTKVLIYRQMNDCQELMSHSVHDALMLKHCDEFTYWMPLPEPPSKVGV